MSQRTRSAPPRWVGGGRSENAAQHLHVRYRDAKTSRAWHLWDAAQIGLWLAVAVAVVWVGRDAGASDADPTSAVVAGLALYVGARAWWFDGRPGVLVGHRWTNVGRALPAVRFGVWVLELAAGAVLVLG